MSISCPSLRKRLQLSSSGNVAIITALSIVPVLLGVGFSVELQRASSAKTRLQGALDSAVLAAGRQYIISDAETEAGRIADAQTVGEEYFSNNLMISKFDISDVSVSFSFDPEKNEISGSATGAIPTILTGLWNIDTLKLGVKNTAVAGDPRPSEIVLSLDNTMSMFNASRFDLMRDAAKGFVNTVFDEAHNNKELRIAVVPWGAVVNIMSEEPGGFDPSPASSIDPPMAGTRTIPHAPFEPRAKYVTNPHTGASVSDAALNTLFAPVGWRGCIRSALNERQVNGGGNVLHPLTDSPPSPMRWPASLVDAELQKRWVDETPSPPPPPSPPPLSPPPPPPPPPPPTMIEGSLKKPAQPRFAWGPRVESKLNLTRVSGVYFSGHVVNCHQNPNQGGTVGARNVFIPFLTDCSSNNSIRKTNTLEPCVSDPNEFAWLAGGGKVCQWQTGILPWNQARGISGPNLNCPTAMLGLSGDRAQVIDKLNHMYPTPGGTLTDIGLMWGLRAMSPHSAWVDFFGYEAGMEPKSFDAMAARKVMIFLTDGTNEPPFHYEGYYGCQEGNSRGEAGACWKATNVDNLNRVAMDNLTLDACTRIRDTYGVELYTILVDVSDTDAQNLMKDCAGDPKRFFNIQTAELDATFQKIATANLRLKN